MSRIEIVCVNDIGPIRQEDHEDKITIIKTKIILHA
jgi:hypothetical protein